MEKFSLSNRSKKKLMDVHPNLVKIVELAIEKYAKNDFTVVEGQRNLEKQKENYVKGVSKTLKSKHLQQSDGYSHAVDLAPLINGQIPWNNKAKFKELANAMFEASKELNIKIRWGGDWNQNGDSNDEKFYDGPHFELV